MATPLQSGQQNHRGGFVEEVDDFFSRKDEELLVGFALVLFFHFCFCVVWIVSLVFFDVFWVSCVVFVFFCTYKANGKLAKTRKTPCRYRPTCMQEASSAAKGVATYASSGGSWWHCPKYPQSSHFCLLLRKFNDKIC